MITPRLLRIISVYLRLTSEYFFAIPFQVDKLGSDFHLKMYSSPKSVLLFTLNFSFQCETMIWSFLRLVQMHMIGEYEGIHHYVIHGFNLIGFGYPSILQLFLMVYGQRFCDTINQAIDYDRALREKYLRKHKHKKPDLLEYGVSVMVPVVYIQGCCFAMFSLMKPSKPFFHCSLLKTLGWPLLAQIPVKIYECYMFINCWHVIVSTWLIFLSAVYSCARWTEELVNGEGLRKVPKEKDRKSITELRTFPHSIQTYQRLFMLHNRFNQLSKVWLVGLAYFSGKAVAIYMGFATIRLGIEQTLPVTQYLAYPTSCLFLGVFLCFCGPEAEKYHTYSIIYIKQLKYHPNRMVRQSVRAILPMSMWVGDFLSVEQGFAIETGQDVVVEIGDLVISVG